MSATLEERIQAARSTLGPAIVTIGRDGRGTGFVVGPDRVLTNIHNLRTPTTQVTFADGEAQQASVVATDTDGDLVVLAVPTGARPVAAWGDPPSDGDAVVAVSRGGFRTRATVGFVSAVDAVFRGPRGRRIEGSVEHTAPLARGSSGGPIADANGHVIGINTHRIGDGFYLARPADDSLRNRVAALVAGRSATRPVLGVALAPVEVARQLRRAVGLEERDGLLVRGVEAGGPAARAGIEEGDLLVAVADHPVASIDDLHRVLDGINDPAELRARVVRGVEERDVVIDLRDPTPGPTA